LFPPRRELFLRLVKETRNYRLPLLFLALFALSRWPGLFPPNFSAATALAFCAGVYFSGATAWWLPLGTMLATDVALNVFYYHTAPVGGYLALNYLIYAALIWLGRRTGARAPFLKLLLGGLFGAIVFYLVTNTLSWLQNPAYLKTLAGWIQALTSGQPGFPPTWMFFHDGRFKFSSDLGIFPQHAFERRAVHGLVCRRGEIDGPRRIAR
jgi:hypothetical protein